MQLSLSLSLHLFSFVSAAPHPPIFKETPINDGLADRVETTHRRQRRHTTVPLSQADHSFSHVGMPSHVLKQVSKYPVLSPGTRSLTLSEPKTQAAARKQTDEQKPADTHYFLTETLPVTKLLYTAIPVHPPQTIIIRLLPQSLQVACTAGRVGVGG